jgi:hypothetical protein
MQRGSGGVEAARLVSVVFAEGATYPAICPSTSHPIEPILPYLFALIVVIVLSPLCSPKDASTTLLPPQANEPEGPLPAAPPVSLYSLRASYRNRVSRLVGRRLRSQILSRGCVRRGLKTLMLPACCPQWAAADEVATYEEFDASQRQNEAQNTQTTPSNTG